MCAFLCVSLLLAASNPRPSSAQDLAQIAEQLERARLLADALKDQLTELKSSTEASPGPRTAPVWRFPANAEPFGQA